MVQMLVILIDGITDSVRLARIRIGCIRHGHSLLCVTDGHCCRRCGRFFGFYD